MMNAQKLIALADRAVAECDLTIPVDGWARPIRRSICRGDP